jgi:hypothetical protein
MKLNPQKCVFGVYSGKFLGFMVSHRGIEANPDKVKAILEMPSPRTMKQLQRLTGRLAALSRFVSRSSDKCLPFFRVLKKAFSWTEECERAFAELKTYLANPPLLSRPVEGEILYLYLAVSRTGVSSVLVREESGKQRPVYFTSKVLHGAEEQYPRIEKLAYALVISARRLRPYFQAQCGAGPHRIPPPEGTAEIGFFGKASQFGPSSWESLILSTIPGQQQRHKPWLIL